MEGKSKYALPTNSESGTFRLLRTACQAFQKRGNQQASASEDFKVYLDEIGSPLYLIQMQGNRFNVSFYNGGAVYFHQKHIKKFIFDKNKPNRLLLAVLEDIGVKVHLAGLRALGIISTLITGPCFRLVGDTEHISEMNPHLHQLQLSLQRFSKSATDLLLGEGAFSEDIVQIHKDEMLEKLLHPNIDEEFQVLTQQILELLCVALLIVLEKQCEDQLPGGKYFSPSPEMFLQASTCPTSNIVSERDFAISKPNARTISLEATIMWIGNKPGEWLDKLPEEESAAYHEQAREMAKKIKGKAKKRRKELLQERKEIREAERLQMEEESRKKEL